MCYILYWNVKIYIYIQSLFFYGFFREVSCFGNDRSYHPALSLSWLYVIWLIKKWFRDWIFSRFKIFPGVFQVFSWNFQIQGFSRLAWKFQVLQGTLLNIRTPFTKRWNICSLHCTTGAFLKVYVNVSIVFTC